jgi:hypothetical protein
MVSVCGGSKKKGVVDRVHSRVKYKVKYIILIRHPKLAKCQVRYATTSTTRSTSPSIGVTETKLAVPVGDAMHLALTAGGQSYIDDEIADYRGEAAAFLLSDACIESCYTSNH